MLPTPGRAVPSLSTTGPSWWRSPSGAEASLSRPGPFPASPRSYWIGEGSLVLGSEDTSLGERFLDLFGECVEPAQPAYPAPVGAGAGAGICDVAAVHAGAPEPRDRAPAPRSTGGIHADATSRDLRTGERTCSSHEPASAPDTLTVRCTVEAAEGSPVVRATFADPEPLDSVEFCETIFEDRGYREIPGGPSPWRLIGSPEDPPRPLMAASGGTCLFDAGGAWQPLLGNLALNRVIRLQRATIFTHAASVSVTGRGVLLPGGKGSGKTTLSLALAARGHGFLGDEIGAVRATDMSLLPVRRAVSIRPGPCAASVRAAVERGGFRREALPDGSIRLRARAGEIFPGSTAEAAPLRAIFFLGPRGDRPACHRIHPRAPEIARLPLSPATLWGVPAPRRFLTLMRLLGSAACFDLRPGDPDDTADLIERTLEAL